MDGVRSLGGSFVAGLRWIINSWGQNIPPCFSLLHSLSRLLAKGGTLFMALDRPRSLFPTKELDVAIVCWRNQKGKAMAHVVCVLSWNCQKCRKLGNPFLLLRLARSVYWRASFSSFRCQRSSEICTPRRVRWPRLRPRGWPRMTPSLSDTGDTGDTGDKVQRLENKLCTRARHTIFRLIKKINK